MMGLGGGLLLLGVATQVAGYQLDASRLAMQLSAKQINPDVTSARRVLFGDNETSIWIQGEPNSMSCPDERGAVPVSEDECRAIGLMAPGQGNMLNPVWPSNTSNMPPGCSMSVYGGNTVLTWNIHAGGPSQFFVLACKEPKYDLYAGGECPAGMVTISETECHQAAIDFHYDYDVNIQPIHNSNTATGCFGKAGDMHFSTHPTGTPGDMESFNLCTFPNGTNVTTSTTTTTPTAGPGGATAAVGDPHMTNLYGQHFDLMKPGVHLLAQVPRYADSSSSLLSISADVRRLGGQCADIYIQVVNVTGSWVPNKYLSYAVGKMPRQAHWQELNQVSLKVIQGHTKTGLTYLNVLLRNLNKVTYPVGGLLGLDDHTIEATPEVRCKKQASLLSLQPAASGSQSSTLR